MTQFAKGLVLDIPDRDQYKTFIENNAFDPGVHFDTWGNNATPEELYIIEYHDDDDPYYRIYNHYTNGAVNKQYIGEEILENAIEQGVLENTGEYDTEFVESQG